MFPDPRPSTPSCDNATSGGHCSRVSPWFDAGAWDAAAVDESRLQSNASAAARAWQPPGRTVTRRGNARSKEVDDAALE
jgi:hypothetical protein